MSKEKSLANIVPYINKNDKVILFDGVCKLCNGWARFVIKYDKKRIFKLASVQSKQGQAVLHYFSMPIDKFDTMILVTENQAHTKSSAFFKVVRHLPFIFRALMIFVIIPRPIRDWLYDRIALNRYKLFGKYEQCLLPTPDHQSRFLK